ncbi:photosystem I reaction center subunit II [Synechococcus elongatus PCC 6301]|nr:photosystem I reaction center subunit II [Synechococcus elongatus PCC 6301]
MAETLTGKTPVFGGSTGGLLKSAETEEKYAITWTSTKEQVFELPTGGAAVMHEGDNLLYFARKEQALALVPSFAPSSNPRSKATKSIASSPARMWDTSIRKMVSSLRK